MHLQHSVNLLRITLRSPRGVHILAEDRTHILKTRGSRTEASKHGLRRHLSVSRHMPGEDSEDTWASEDTFPAKTLLGARTRGRPKTLSERKALAKALAGVKPCACEKTIAEDKSGEGKRRRDDTWAREDTSRKQVG